MRKIPKRIMPIPETIIITIAKSELIPFYIKTDPSSNIYDEIRIADQYMYTNKAKSKLR